MMIDSQHWSVSETYVKTKNTGVIHPVITLRQHQTFMRENSLKHF